MVLKGSCYLKGKRMRNQEHGLYAMELVVKTWALELEENGFHLISSYTNFVIWASYLISLCPRILLYLKKKSFIF